nr:MAG TPA: hypothetical protein [Caudoviricetes sp.]
MHSDHIGDIYIASRVRKLKEKAKRKPNNLIRVVGLSRY